jgi:hypothetical protein
MPLDPLQERIIRTRPVLSSTLLELGAALHPEDLAAETGMVALVVAQGLVDRSSLAGDVDLDTGVQTQDPKEVSVKACTRTA